MAKPNDEQMLALQAELEAARAEIAALKSGGTKKVSTKTSIPDEKLAPADTLLGQVQRLDRAKQIDAFPKLARMIGAERACELIVSFASEVASKTNSTAEDVIKTVTTVAPKKAKGEKVVDDATGGEPAAQ